MIRLKCCYVCDPTLTWNENEQTIYNEFLNAGKPQERPNTTEMMNISNQNSGLKAIEEGPSQDMMEDSIFHEEGNIHTNQRNPKNNK